MYIILYCLGSTIMSLLMAFNMNISLSDETLWSLEEVELVSIDTHKVFRKKKITIVSLLALPSVK